MSIRVETISAAHVRVERISAEDANETNPNSLDPYTGDVLALDYDESVFIEGDLKAFADKIVKAVYGDRYGVTQTHWCHNEPCHPSKKEG